MQMAAPQLCCACAEWNAIRAVQTAGTQVQVCNLVDGTLDDLDFRDRVIKMAIGESGCRATSKKSAGTSLRMHSAWWAPVSLL